MNKKAVKWLYQELPELVAKGVLTPSSAESLKKHYGPLEETSGARRALLIFGVIGVILVGLGVMLILAHNWPQLTKGVRLAIAAGLLAAAQLLAGLALHYKPDSRVWRECTATLQALMLGTAMALVGQTYHLTEDTAMFLRNWLLLSLPLIYLLESDVVAGLYLLGVAAWSSAGRYSPEHQLVWLFLLLAIPYCRRLVQTARYANTTISLLWMANLVFYFCFMTAWGSYFSESAFLIYSLLFTVNFLLGLFWFNSSRERWRMPFQAIGLTGSLALIYLLTFNSSWRYLHWDISGVSLAEGSLILVLSILAAGGSIRLIRQAGWRKLQYSVAPLIIGGAYLLQFYQPGGIAATVLLNCYLLALSISMITAGIRRSSLTRVNTGLLLLALLIAARFFDIDFSFVVRGLVFVILGIAFLVTNLLIVRRKKSEETV
ncbi:DUF2157 domain-containing protein|uniref:Uncharacterized membrane protein n=1 Tax=Dendrosporobacter quercicolus TaxID=146817 RepID=A0A1G9TXM5_9FIRM|nr:DUF2157 domain-containing protein [Dendrosporobacter quercicolus]NSL48818.1 DUF2157 domain-containing protein [Dendrosporobacter quercicolus DSM 1736]SDM52509.1 Uncharacterized membrane protein [Dendrosporobacter quercicolus]